MNKKVLIIFLIVYEIQIIPQSNVTEFFYDTQNSLTSIVYADGKTITYSYDAVGNRISKTINNTLIAKANLKIYLQSCYNNGEHTTTLKMNNYLPLSQPYNVAPWNYTGSETVNSIPNNVVDWILLELRSNTNSSSIVSKRAAFIKNNGTIVDLDGTSQVSFSVNAGNYYIVIRPRNYLAVMSVSIQALNSSNGTLYDFTSEGKAYGNNPMAHMGNGIYGMIAGDVNGDGIIDATDRSLTWNNRLQTGYKNCDVNLDGIVDATDRSEIWNKRLLQSKVP